ncbi:MAG: VacJ family lipoprotein, partial [Gammaproteobacteria bacterium]|nr:VacJ family lipoprotein [Gammaproteobacteria bacterium]
MRAGQFTNLSDAGRLAGLCAALLLMGCAGNPQSDAAADNGDPWEPFNRKMYALNRGVDRAALRPLAKGYRKIMPNFAQRGVSNFFDNLSTPASAVNNLLQGKPGRGLSEFGRFLFNSTLGVGGLIDITGHSGVPRYAEDFGQTLAVWG